MKDETLTREEYLNMLMNFEFTILIADGIKDSQDDVLYVGRGTHIEFKESMSIQFGERGLTIGDVRVIRVGQKLKAQFRHIRPDIDLQALLHLTPSISGKVNVRDQAFVRSISIRHIDINIVPNVDYRIKSIWNQIQESDLDKKDNLDTKSYGNDCEMSESTMKRNYN